MLYSDPVTQGDDDSTVWRKLCHALQNQVPVGQPPVNILPPVVSGSYGVGNVLSTTDGTWLHDPVSFAYQWRRGGVDILGATLSTYEMTSSDVGSGISCVVTASNPFGSTPQASNAINDPLAGIAFQIRLERYVGLYQDVACTIPCTADFDLVAAWRDELSGSGYIFSQADETRRPFFIGGAPVFDGSDDSLLCSTIALGYTQALGVTGYEASNQYVVWDGLGPGDTGCWHRFGGNGNGYLGNFLATRIEDYPTGMPNSGLRTLSISSTALSYEAFVDGVSQGVQAGTVQSLVGASLRIGASLFQGTGFQAGPVNGLWITDNIAARTTIESYAETLNI
jgi:hypothetical protein